MDEERQKHRQVDDPERIGLMFLGCPFCEYSGPSEILHDWGDSYAIEPIDAVVRGHVLVIPKAHVTSFSPSPPTTAMVMQRASEYVAIKGGEWNLITSSGRAATQTVMHLHVHLVPRSEYDGLKLPWSPESKRESDAVNLLGRIYAGKSGNPLYDSDMVVEWIEQEIAAFIREHGPFSV